MDLVVKDVLDYDLSGNDINTVCRGKVKVLIYKDLLECNNIFEAIGSTNRAILLFPTKKGNDYYGHWIAIIYHPSTKTIFHFDSYAISVKDELGYSENGTVRKNLLGNLYAKAFKQGYKIHQNHIRLQEMSTGINTCGRWCSIRCRMWYLTNSQFAALFKDQKLSPDELITMMSFLVLGEDENDEKNIIKVAIKSKIEEGL